MDSLKLVFKKWIGSWLGIWCSVCGSPLEDVGYNFNVRCSNEGCSSRKEEGEHFYIRPVTREAGKHMSETHKKRGKPKKIQ